MESGESDTSTGARYMSFPPTAWTKVQAAKGDDDAAREALEPLCKFYWKSVFGFILRRTPNHERAKDLTQDFFCRLIQSGILVNEVDRTRGKFRTFLAQRLKWFVQEMHKKPPSVIEGAVSSEHLKAMPATKDLVDDGFDLACARELVEHALNRLDDHFRDDGKLRRRQIFQLMRKQISATEIAAKMKLNLDTVKNELKVINKDSDDCLREFVRATVADASHVDEEVGLLRSYLKAGARNRLSGGQPDSTS